MILMYKIGVLGDKGQRYGFPRAGAGGGSLRKHRASAGEAEKYGGVRLCDYLYYRADCQRPCARTGGIPGAACPRGDSDSSNQGSLGLGMANVKKNIERAVGADIIGD